MNVFSLHVNTTDTLHVYHIHYMYYDLPHILLLVEMPSIEGQARTHICTT